MTSYRTPQNETPNAKKKNIGVKYFCVLHSCQIIRKLKRVSLFVDYSANPKIGDLYKKKQTAALMLVEFSRDLTTHKKELITIFQVEKRPILPLNLISIVINI